MDGLLLLTFVQLGEQTCRPWSWWWQRESQDEVRNPKDGTESCQWKQHNQCGAEDKPILLHISLDNRKMDSAPHRRRCSSLPPGCGRIPGYPHNPLLLQSAEGSALRRTRRCLGTECPLTVLPELLRGRSREKKENNRTGDSLKSCHSSCSEDRPNNNRKS